MVKQILNIIDFDVVNIYGIDCANILQSDISQLNSLRGTHDLLRDIKLKFLNTETFEFRKPVYDESEYAKTDRVGRDTFSSFFSYNLMPLSFEAINSKKYHEKEFTFSFHSIKLSPKCALTIRVVINLNKQ